MNRYLRHANHHLLFVKLYILGLRFGIISPRCVFIWDTSLVRVRSSAKIRAEREQSGRKLTRAALGPGTWLGGSEAKDVYGNSGLFESSCAVVDPGAGLAGFGLIASSAKESGRLVQWGAFGSMGAVWARLSHTEMIEFIPAERRAQGCLHERFGIICQGHR